MAERVRAGDLAPERLRVAAYLGDPDARTALAAVGAQLPPARRALSPQPSQATRQWILGLSDVCAPDDREPIARLALAALLRLIDHDDSPAELDELLARDKPWSVLRTAAGWGEHVLGELDDRAAIERALREAIVPWALS